MLKGPTSTRISSLLMHEFQHSKDHTHSWQVKTWADSAQNIYMVEIMCPDCGSTMGSSYRMEDNYGDKAIVMTREVVQAALQRFGKNCEEARLLNIVNEIHES